MIEFATERDKAELIDVFCESFIGEEKFAEWLFDCLWACENTLVVRQNNKILSALHILPQKIVAEGQEFSAYYIYGVGTIVAARGCGHAANLLSEVERVARLRQIDAVFLIPAEKSLFGYYKKFGYNDYFFVHEEKIERKEIEKGYEIAQMSDCHFAQMIKIYNREMAGRTHVLRNEDSFDMLLKTYGAENSHVLICNNKVIAYSFCEAKHGAVYVLEAFGEKSKMLAQSLGDILRMPAQSERSPIGMLIDISERIPQGGAASYCNLLFN